MTPRRTILFVCVHNAGRSRIAAAYLNALAGDRFDGISAGTDPAQHPHPEVVEAMAADGIALDITPGTLLTSELTDQAIRVIGMGCAVEEACPALRVPLEDWGLPDPKGQPPERVLEIRDEIKLRVTRLIEELDAGGS